jgi:hypothetical protein
MRTTLKTVALTLAAAALTAALPTAASAEVASRTAAAGQAQAPALYDFRVPGVRIFSRPDGNSSRNGLGYPGQGWDTNHGATGTWYTCDNGVSTTWWEYGRNVATGVVGWVPSCNTISP